MKNNILLIISLIALPFSCTNENIEDDVTKEVVGVASMDNMSRAVNKVPVVNGTFQLGYNDDEVKEVNVINSTIGSTGLYWPGMKKNKGSNSFFTLSNVEKGKESLIPEGYDILWAYFEGWDKNLEFTLHHRMAQVNVNVTLEDSEEEISSIYLEGMSKKIIWSRSDGLVNTDATENKTITLAKNDNGIFASLLPPQKRKANMKLFVVTNKGTYSKTIPEIMTVEIENTSNTQGITLEFRRGYILTLDAEIKQGSDMTIQFIGATLQDWKYVLTTSIPTKSAGIYTLEDLKKWISIYNSGRGGNVYQLLKYGTFDGSNWTFILKADIDATSLFSDLEKIANFQDSLVRESSKSYSITVQNGFTLITGGIWDSSIIHN